MPGWFRYLFTWNYVLAENPDGVCFWLAFQVPACTEQAAVRPEAAVRPKQMMQAASKSWSTRKEKGYPMYKVTGIDKLTE